MKPVSVLNVQPNLPESLRPLLRIAYNLRWTWDHAAIDLFRRLDSDLWESSNRNPVLMLGKIDQSLLESAAADDSFLAHMNGVAAALDQYMSGVGSWYRHMHGKEENLLIAYFSAEFGITECLAIFAGGLGILAGDHLKASSDLGLPLVGVGLLYQQGYFRQHLNAAGWQQEAFEDNDFHTWPIELVPNVTIRVELPSGPVAAQVWRARVGTLQLYLLDSNIPENRREDRKITEQLYGGDLEMRLRQEILLGIGGYRALEALGLRPTVYHMNEGHSAFLGIEHIVRRMETANLSFAEAKTVASAGLVFTTHTPVPAGHDYFPASLMDRYFHDYMVRLNVDRSQFLALGRQDSKNDGEDFCMTVLALRLASYSNGVSRLHGSVSRRMWNRIWPAVPEFEVPIGHVTNGVHLRTWVSSEMNQLYDRYLGPKWREDPADAKLWQRAESIPAGELWRTHERRRERLVGVARLCLREQLSRRGASKTAVQDADEVLNPDALTIGFGRRFASYKRATLILRDPDRLARLLNDPRRPVQIIFAGKAHPRDNFGKELIQAIVNTAARPEFRRKIVFLENYGMALARSMVQGCDVWLNNPLRPQEASGTSGMKAQANGALNVSTLDGWWDEAWRMGAEANSEIGWAIGSDDPCDDPQFQDQLDAEALYELLEREIVPSFYDRRADGLPRKWIARMKKSIATLCPQFNMQRMAMQYADEYYLAAHHRSQALQANDCERARALAAWQGKVARDWQQIGIEVIGESASEINLGDEVLVSVRVSMGSLTPENVAVQVLSGRVHPDGEIKDHEVVPMLCSGQDGLGKYLFQAVVRPTVQSGLHGYAIRVLPKHADSISLFLPGLILWASSAPAVAESRAR